MGAEAMFDLINCEIPGRKYNKNIQVAKFHER